MKPGTRGEEFGTSEMIYGRLLRAYPPRHRAQYGAAMTQLFRDQCRDAWRESQTWGLWKLWLRILSDLACTSILERLAALKERKTMSEKLANLSTFRTTPASTFFKVFVVVFLVVFLASVALTFLLPESYASTARIKVEMEQENRVDRAQGNPPSYDAYFIQTEFEIIQSQVVLKPVIDKLKLNKQWGKKYFAGQTLEPSETLEILRQRLQLAPVKNTKLVAITVFSDDRQEAAQIANAVANSYRDYREGSRVELAARGLQVLEDNYLAQEQQIEKSQAAVEALQKEFGVLDDVHVQGIGAITANSETTFQEKNALLARLRALSKEERRNVLPTVAADPGLSNLLGKLHDAQQKFATLTNDYARGHIEVQRVISLMDVLNGQIDDRVEGIMAGLESQLVAIKTASDDLAAKAQKSKPTPENRPYWEAKQNLEHLFDSHKVLLARIEAEKLDAKMPQTTLVQLVDAARPGHAPVKPNKTLNIVLGAAVGSFLGLVAGGFSLFIAVLFGKRMTTTPMSGGSGTAGASGIALHGGFTPRSWGLGFLFYGLAIVLCSLGIALDYSDAVPVGTRLIVLSAVVLLITAIRMGHLKRW